MVMDSLNKITYPQRLFLWLLGYSVLLVGCFVVFQYGREKEFKAGELNTKLQLINTSGSFVYAYQWMSSNPEVATVDPEGLVTAQKPGTTTITALATNGQALRCAVTVNSDVGKVTLNKRDLLLRTVGSKEALTASVAVEDGTNVPITWVSSNPGVVTVDADGVVTAIADGEAKVTALSPAGRFDVCSVVVGMAAEKYESEADLADELKLPDPYVAVRLNKLA